MEAILASLAGATTAHGESMGAGEYVERELGIVWPEEGLSGSEIREALEDMRREDERR